MSGLLTVQSQVRTSHLSGDLITTTPTTPQTVEGQDGGRSVSVSSLIKKFDKEKTTGTEKSKGPPTRKPPEPPTTRPRSVSLTERPSHLKGVSSPSKGPQTTPTTTPELTPIQKKHQENIQKFGSKTANLDEMARIGVTVPGRSPVSTKEIFDHLLSQDKDKVIQRSWDKMKLTGKVDDVNLKKITDKIEEIFNKGDFPFTKEQKEWIEVTMAGKVIIARSTGDEDSADTPNAGGNESVLFVEPNTASVSKAMKEVVLSYFGADSLRNRIVGDGMGTVLSGLPKMPVLLMEMIAEPIKDGSKPETVPPKPPIGIAMSTDKVEFTGGEDFHFVSISSAVGPGVNEGNGRIEVDETFVMQAKDGTPLLIYQQPSVKEERIRAVKDSNGKISSQMEKNSKELAYSPSLSRDQVRELVTSTDKIKGLNNGATTEVEGVVGGDKALNFVQHRPIPDSRSKVDPTYVSTTQSDNHSKVFNYTTVVPKSGDALVIDDWSQVCFAETMKEAEAMFDWTGGKQKLVIVRQPDCSNSHPAVNFGSYKKEVNGKKEPNPIPCLVVPNYGELLAMKKDALSSSRPLVIDGQTQKAFVWTDSSFVSGTAITKGRISHHIGLETGATGEGVKELVGQLKTTPSGQIGTLKGEMDKILDVYAKEIEKLENQLTDNADTIHNSEGLKIQLQTTKANFEAVKGAFAEVLAGRDPNYTFEPLSHGRLLLVKFLESSLHDIESFPQLIEAGKSATKYLQAMKGSPVDKVAFGDESNLSAKEGLTGPVALRWKRFLALAEQSGLSKEEIADFKNMMVNLDKMGVTSTWMSTVFDKMYAEILPPRDKTGTTSAVPKAKELLQALVKDYETTAPFLRKQQAFQKKLEDAERSVADFSSKSKYQKAFDNLKGLAETFIKEDWPQDLNKNGLKRAAQVESLGRMIEVYDSSIKALKNSDFDTPELLAKELEMLDTFKSMFESLFMKVDLPSKTPMPRATYVKNMDEAYTKIKDKVKIQTSTRDDEGLKAHARIGKDFNVTNSLFNNRAKIMPENVEEMFTTIHQSLEDIRGGIMTSGGSVFDIDLPQEVVNVLSSIPDLARATPTGIPPDWVGREVTSTGVTYTHNLIVNDHGVKIRTQYEKPTPEHPKGRTTLEIDFYADNMGGRLENLSKLARQINPGVEAVWGAQQFKAKFDLGTIPDLQTFSGHLQKIVNLSVSMTSGTLGLTVQSNNLPPSNGDLNSRRQQALNDFLNVVFGAPSKVKGGAKAPFINTTKYNIQFGYPKTFSFKDGWTTHKLDLSKPNFGLKQSVFSKIPSDVLKQANQALLDGPTKFSFKRNGKTYPVDLTKSDLGLTDRAINRLGLNKENLAVLRADLQQTLKVASSDINRDPETNLKHSWRGMLFGQSKAYTTDGTPPGLALWKSVTEVPGTTRSEQVQILDNLLGDTLQTKLDLDQAREKLRLEGDSPQPKTIANYRNLLQDYHTGLQKTMDVSRGFHFCRTQESNDGMALDLTRACRTELGVVTSELAEQGLKPILLTLRERGRLPFFDLDPGLRDEGKPVPKIIQDRAKLDRPQEDRGKFGERITALNIEISTAVTSLKDKGEIDDYSMAMGVLASSTHLISGSDLSKIESTWKTDRKEAINQILKLDFVATSSDVDALTKPGGVKVGLTNGGADCFINSSLQLLGGIGGLTVSKDMPHLGNFLTGKIQNGGDCRGLRDELRTKAFHGNKDIREAIVDGTAISQQDAAATVSLLLEKTRAPKIEFTKKLTRNDNGAERTGYNPPTHILPLQLPQATGQHSLTQVFTSNLTSQVEVSWPGAQLNQKATQTLTLKDPAPDSTVISLSRYTYTAKDGPGKRRDVITGLTNPVSLTDDRGNNVQYQASSIICHIGTGVESGHYITYRKEGADWLLFNDNSEVGVRVDLNTQPHKDRIERDSYVVGMAKVGKDYTPPTIPPDIEVAVPLPVGNRGPTSGSDKQVKSGSPTVTPQTVTPQTVTPQTVTPQTTGPWAPSKTHGITKSQLQTQNVLAPPTRSQTGVHEFHTKAFKALFEGGVKFPTGDKVKAGDTFSGKVTIEGKEYNLTATAMSAKGSGAVIWTASLSENGGSSPPTEFVVKANPVKPPIDSSPPMRELAELTREKDLREVQVLDHMSGNEHALQFHGAYSMPDGTLIYGMEKAGKDVSEILGERVQARTSSSLVPSSMDKQLLEMSQALRDIHATGQVHGDVKSDNFMVGSDGSVRIADFGESYVKDGSSQGTKLKDDLQGFATMAFNLRNGVRVASDTLQTTIESQQKGLQTQFNSKIFALESDLTKQISQLEKDNPLEPLIGELRQQVLDLNDPDKRLDTILKLSGGKLDDESVRSYLINDLLLKTLQTPAPSFDTMDQVSTQLARLVAQ